jgi:hypothetical protein
MMCSEGRIEVGKLRQGYARTLRLTSLSRSSAGGRLRKLSTRIPRRFDGGPHAGCPSSTAMHTTAPKTQVADGLRSTTLNLLEALNELLTALVRARSSLPRPARERDSTLRVRDVGWLRPLAIAGVELEHAVRWPSAHHTVALAARCDELIRLLVASPASGGDFARRYAVERTRSPSLATLHARVMAGCAQVMSRCSPSSRAYFDESRAE